MSSTESEKGQQASNSFSLTKKFRGTAVIVGLLASPLVVSNRSPIDFFQYFHNILKLEWLIIILSAMKTYLFSHSVCLLDERKQQSLLKTKLRTMNNSQMVLFIYLFNRIFIFHLVTYSANRWFYVDELDS